MSVKVLSLPGHSIQLQVESKANVFKNLHEVQLPLIQLALGNQFPKVSDLCKEKFKSLPESCASFHVACMGPDAPSSPLSPPCPHTPLQVRLT